MFQKVKSFDLYNYNVVLSAPCAKLSEKYAY